MLIPTIALWYMMKHNVYRKVDITHLLLIRKRKEIFYLTTHSIHFIYGYMVLDIWSTQIVREESRCCHMGYFSDLQQGIFYMHHPHRQDRTYNSRWIVGSILHGVNPLSYFSFQPVPHDWCNKDCGMCYPVCGMVHIKEPLLLIGKSSPCGGSGFPLTI